MCQYTVCMSARSCALCVCVCWLILYSSLRDTQTKASCWFPLASVHTHTHTHTVYGRWIIQNHSPPHCYVHKHAHFHPHTYMCTDTEFFPSTQLLARLQRITVGPFLFVAFMPQWRFLLLLLLARSTAFPMRQCCRPLISTLAAFALLSWLQLNSWQSSSTAGPKTWAMSRRPSQGHQFVSDFHLFMWHFYLFILRYKCWFEIFLIFSSHF